MLNFFRHAMVLSCIATFASVVAMVSGFQGEELIKVYLACFASTVLFMMAWYLAR